jgi:hypothetical protein
MDEHLARIFRLKAAKYRAVADQTQDPVARESLRRRAETYDRLGDRY